MHRVFKQRQFDGFTVDDHGNIRIPVLGEMNVIGYTLEEIRVRIEKQLLAEYFNKEEFSQKLIIPTASLKKMQIVEVKNDSTNQITFIRLIQE